MVAKTPKIAKPRFPSLLKERGISWYPPQKGTLMNPSMTDWYHLMLEADRLSERTGWGLAPVWGHINHGEYEEAVARLQGIYVFLAGHPLEAERARKNGANQAGKHEATFSAWREENGFSDLRWI